MSRQRDFVAVPRALVRDPHITAGAKHLYLVLVDVAWNLGWRDGGQEIQLPSREDLADHAGTSLAMIKRHLTELRATGWIVTRRGNRRAPSIYVIHDDRSGPDGSPTIHPGPSDGPYESRPNAPEGSPETRRAQITPLLTTRDTEGALRAPSRGAFNPVVGANVEGRNVAFDALVAETGATGRLNAARVAVALRSIREEAWKACVARGFTLEQAAGQPERYERGLAAEIRRRGTRLRSEHPDWTITPETIARYWTRMGERTVTRAERVHRLVSDQLATA